MISDHLPLLAVWASKQTSSASNHSGVGHSTRCSSEDRLFYHNQELDCQGLNQRNSLECELKMFGNDHYQFQFNYQHDPFSCIPVISASLWQRIIQGYRLLFPNIPSFQDSNFIQSRSITIYNKYLQSLWLEIEFIVKYNRFYFKSDKLQIQTLAKNLIFNSIAFGCFRRIIISVPIKCIFNIHYYNFDFWLTSIRCVSCQICIRRHESLCVVDLTLSGTETTTLPPRHAWLEPANRGWN